MSGQIYNWKRFWYRRGANVDLYSKGYLYDPASMLAPFMDLKVFPFESIAITPCLVLLGEPGIGKSHTMQTEKDSVETQIETSGDLSLWLDLHSYGSEDRLVRALFENTTFFTFR